jgi:hypothetical protein
MTQAIITKLAIRKMELCIKTIGATGVERARLFTLIEGFNARIAQLST